MKTLIAIATLIGFIIGYTTGVNWHGLTLYLAEENKHSDNNVNVVPEKLMSDHPYNQPNEVIPFKAQITLRDLCQKIVRRNVLINKI